MENPNENYIAQTAKDYDLDFETVLRIYKRSKDGNDFYDRLESTIDRSQASQEQHKAV